MTPIDLVMGFIGGLMIGSAASLFLLFNGRIMGASGILGGLIDGTGRHNMAERIALIAGLIGVPFVAITLTGANVSSNITDNIALLVVGGLLVGYGTRTAGGCTSGHGVCGISRFSLRGIVATLVYLLAGGVTMLVARHMLGVI